MNMINKRFLVVSVAGLLAFGVVAEEAEQERVTFGKWRLTVGGAFNAQVRPDLGMRNFPIPSPFVVPSGSTKADALARADSRRYDGGGFIDADRLDNGFDTTNWKLPVSAYAGAGHFVLDNPYQEVIGSSSSVMRRNDADNCDQFGIAFEASREIWIHDEEDEHRWGVDFAAAFSYFFARDVYQAHTSVSRSDTVRDGVIRTDVNDPDAMYDYDQGWDSPVGGMYGYGVLDRQFVEPALGFAGIGSPYDAGGPSHVVASSSGYSANGDYQELEMLFMLRPWYEITDWWRVFAEIGVGVSWGRLDTTFYGVGRGYDEDFSQWDCYGVAGLGTAFRYRSISISIDVLGRFLRDDFDVNGRYVSGSINRSDWGIRLMVGYEF